MFLINLRNVRKCKKEERIVKNKKKMFQETYVKWVKFPK